MCGAREGSLNELEDAERAEDSEYKELNGQIICWCCVTLMEWFVIVCLFDAFILHSTALSSLTWVYPELPRCSVEEGGGEKEKKGGKTWAQAGQRIFK